MLLNIYRNELFISRYKNAFFFGFVGKFTPSLTRFLCCCHLPSLNRVLMKERTPCEMVHLKVDSQMTREDNMGKKKKCVN